LAKLCLVRAGVIERIVASTWVSPIVATKKEFGKIRMCVDLREPNKAMIVDSFSCHRWMNYSVL